MHPHDSRQRRAAGEIESQHISCGETAARPCGSLDACAGGLRSCELLARLSERLPPLGEQLRIVKGPDRKVPASVNRGYSPVPNGRIQTADFELRYRKRENGGGAVLWIIQLFLKLLNRLPRGFHVVEPIFNQFTKVIAYVTRNVI
jgi:hypothetical protein